MLTFSNGETIETTIEHPFYVQDRGFTPAGLVAIGNSIVTRAGPSLEVTDVEKHNSAQKVYSFEVAEFHTYFVGKAGLWVHNQCRIDLDENFLKHVMGDGSGIVSAAKRRANGSVEGGVKGTHNYKRFKDNYSNKVNIKSDTEFAPGFREVTYDGTPLYDSSGNLLPGKGNILLKKTTFDPDKITPNQYIDMVSQAVNEGFQAGRKRINPDGSTASRVFRGYSASPLGGAPIQFEFVINPKTKEIITAYPIP